MTGAEFIAILPLILTAVSAVAVMLAIAVVRSHAVAAAATLIGLALALCAVGPALSVGPTRVTPLLVMDGYGLFYTALILAASLVVTLLSYGYLRDRPARPEEFHVLLLLATLGAMVLACANHFASVFLGLEILSVSLYALLAYQRGNPLGAEAGLKYLVPAGVSSAFLLLGMALVYADTGALELAGAAGPAPAPASAGMLLLTGLGMIVVGLGFKLAVVPFHLWTADVYQGAPAPVTAFVATVSKGAAFALLLRYFANFRSYDLVLVLFALIAIVSMFVGNLLALLQDNVKRILAYSSIAHLGYLLVAFLAGAGACGMDTAALAASYYLLAYFVTTLAAFGVVTVLSGPGRDADRMEDYRGLAWRRPALAGVMTAAMLSLAGLPLTAGFVGKFYLLLAGVGSGMWLLVVVLAVNSAIGLFYYLRIVAAMYRAAAPAPGGRAPARTAAPLAAGLVLAGLTLLLLWLGVWPAPMIRLIQAMQSGWLPGS